jgi:cytochrome b561
MHMKAGLLVTLLLLGRVLLGHMAHTESIRVSACSVEDMIWLTTALSKETGGEAL